MQKSLDLLDRVLSEFDDCENGNPESQLAPVTDGVSAVTTFKSCTTPEDESPSGLGGHQSEDDGYMSMNGRKAKLLLTNSASSSNDFTNSEDVTTPETPPPIIGGRFPLKARMNGDFPPPPEEAERIISTLLPR